MNKSLIYKIQLNKGIEKVVKICKNENKELWF